MNRFFRELRRREVFRTAGLYVGVCWILIEASSVLLPTFDAPEWILRAIIIVTFVGFPVMLVLAWVYDLTDHGIEVQADVTETMVVRQSRKMDVVVIGILTVALLFSVYLNVTSGPEIIEEPDPLSVLIADFDNQTGNPLFDGSLEQALGIGIEGASFVSAYPRNNALKQAKELELGDKLNEETARLVAVRRDLNMVLSGSIVPDGSKFELTLRAIDPVSGEVIADTDATARDGTGVLAAMNELTIDMRKSLGEDSTELGEYEADESLTATSLQAIKHYTTAQELALAGRDEEAIEFYARAIEEDAEFARAYSGWGLSANKLGRSSESEEKWQQALGLLDRLTERERYRTLGLYYSFVSLNFSTAIENYQKLVERFPADGAGMNNLAVLYTMTAQYDRALATSEQLLQMYPNLTFYHANNASYAMYAGDMETLRAEAQYVLDDNPGYHKSYMFLATAELHAGNVDTAKSNYERMMETGIQGQSLASIGLADIALFEGDAAAATRFLEDGIEADRTNNNERGLGTKRVALAQARMALGDNALALSIIDELNATRGDGQLVPSASIYAANGRYDDAFAIAENYRKQLSPTARAYANLIDGINAFHQEEYILAIDSFRLAIESADLWIVRYHLAQAYLAAGYPAEATAELDACIERRGEAGNLFFDDVPTWRYTASLNDWKSNAMEALSNQVAAND